MDNIVIMTGYKLELNFETDVLSIVPIDKVYYRR